MHVVYDISVLGSSLYSRRARTGVARVINDLGLALDAQDEVDLSYCAFNSLEQYLQLRINIHFVDLLNSSSLRFSAHPLAKELSDIIGKIYPKVNSGQSKGLRRRILSMLLRTTNQFLGGFDRDVLTGVDIFHSTFYPFPELRKGSRLLKRFITVYDLIPILYPDFFGGRKDHLAHKIVDCIRPDDWVIAISESTKHDLCNYAQIDPSKVFVTPLAASDTFYCCTDAKKIVPVKARYGIPEGRYVLSLCTLEPRKNVDQVIRSYIQLVQEQSADELSLVLVGAKGWNYDEIFKEIKYSSTVKDRIIVTGYVPDEDLAALYSGAMMFVYPSFYEGFGLPPLEAMQCGVPVITSNTSSLPEVVGDAGILVDPTDGDTICQAMLDIYKQSSLRESLSAKALERAKLFSWEKCAQQTVAAYKTALGS